jgi:hypothetical protein
MTVVWHPLPRESLDSLDTDISQAYLPFNMAAVSCPLSQRYYSKLDLTKNLGYLQHLDQRAWRVRLGVLGRGFICARSRHILLCFLGKD